MEYILSRLIIKIYSWQRWNACALSQQSSNRKTKVDNKKQQKHTETGNATRQSGNRLNQLQTMKISEPKQPANPTGPAHYRLHGARARACVSAMWRYIDSRYFFN